MSFAHTRFSQRQSIRLNSTQTSIPRRRASGIFINSLRNNENSKSVEVLQTSPTANSTTSTNKRKHWNYSPRSSDREEPHFSSPTDSSRNRQYHTRVKSNTTKKSRSKEEARRRISTFSVKENRLLSESNVEQRKTSIARAETDFSYADQSDKAKLNDPARDKKKQMDAYKSQLRQYLTKNKDIFFKDDNPKVDVSTNPFVPYSKFVQCIEQFNILTPQPSENDIRSLFSSYEKEKYGMVRLTELCSHKLAFSENNGNNEAEKEEEQSDFDKQEYGVIGRARVGTSVEIRPMSPPLGGTDDLNEDENEMKSFEDELTKLYSVNERFGKRKERAVSSPRRPKGPNLTVEGFSIRRRKTPMTPQSNYSEDFEMDSEDITPAMSPVSTSTSMTVNSDETMSKDGEYSRFSETATARQRALKAKQRRKSLLSVIATQYHQPDTASSVYSDDFEVELNVDTKVEQKLKEFPNTQNSKAQLPRTQTSENSNITAVEILQKKLKEKSISERSLFSSSNGYRCEKLPLRVFLQNMEEMNLSPMPTQEQLEIIYCSYEMNSDGSVQWNKIERGGHVVKQTKRKLSVIENRTVSNVPSTNSDFENLHFHSKKYFAQKKNSFYRKKSLNFSNIQFTDQVKDDKITSRKQFIVDKLLLNGVENPYERKRICKLIESLGKMYQSGKLQSAMRRCQGPSGRIYPRQFRYGLNLLGINTSSSQNEQGHGTEEFVLFRQFDENNCGYTTVKVVLERVVQFLSLQDGRDNDGKIESEISLEDGIQLETRNTEIDVKRIRSLIDILLDIYSNDSSFFNPICNENGFIDARNFKIYLKLKLANYESAKVSNVSTFTEDEIIGVWNTVYDGIIEELRNENVSTSQVVVTKLHVSDIIQFLERHSSLVNNDKDEKKLKLPTKLEEYIKLIEEKVNASIHNYFGSKKTNLVAFRRGLVMANVKPLPDDRTLQVLHHISCISKKGKITFPMLETFQKEHVEQSENSKKTSIISLSSPPSENKITDLVISHAKEIKSQEQMKRSKKSNKELGAHLRNPGRHETDVKPKEWRNSMRDAYHPKLHTKEHFFYGKPQVSAFLLNSEENEMRKQKERNENIQNDIHQTSHMYLEKRSIIPTTDNDFKNIKKEMRKKKEAEGRSLLRKVKRRMVEKFRTAPEFFFIADANRNNNLSFDEFKRGFAMMGIRPIPSERQLQLLYDYVDSEVPDGKLSWKEFKVALEDPKRNLLSSRDPFNVEFQSKQEKIRVKLESLDSENLNHIEHFAGQLKTKCKTIADFFHHAGFHQSEKLTFSKFKRAVCLIGFSPMPSNKILRAIFNFFDMDRTNNINVREMETALHRLYKFEKIKLESHAPYMTKETERDILEKTIGHWQHYTQGTDSESSTIYNTDDEEDLSDDTPKDQYYMYSKEENLAKEVDELLLAEKTEKKRSKKKKKKLKHEMSLQETVGHLVYERYRDENIGQGGLNDKNIVDLIELISNCLEKRDVSFETFFGTADKLNRGTWISKVEFYKACLIYQIPVIENDVEVIFRHVKLLSGNHNQMSYDFLRNMLSQKNHEIVHARGKKISKFHEEKVRQTLKRRSSAMKLFSPRRGEENSEPRQFEYRTPKINYVEKQYDEENTGGKRVSKRIKGFQKKKIVRPLLSSSSKPNNTRMMSLLKQVKNVFAKLPYEKRGKFSYGRFKGFLTDENVKLSQTELLALFHQIDTDNDGIIDMFNIKNAKLKLLTSEEDKDVTTGYSSHTKSSHLRKR
eukprot:g6393.t1